MRAAVAATMFDWERVTMSGLRLGSVGCQTKMKSASFSPASLLGRSGLAED